MYQIHLTDTPDCLAKLRHISASPAASRRPKGLQRCPEAFQGRPGHKETAKGHTRAQKRRDKPRKSPMGPKRESKRKPLGANWPPKVTQTGPKSPNGPPSHGQRGEGGRKWSQKRPPAPEHAQPGTVPNHNATKRYYIKAWWPYGS